MAVRIVIISGPCGSGKTSIARSLAEKSEEEKAIHIHTDDFFEFIRKGYVAPWLDASGEQNEVIYGAVAASTQVLVENGYEVFVDGAIGPWFLEPWLKIVEAGVDVRYVVLRPDVETTVKRGMEREQREAFPLQEEDSRSIWGFFRDLGKYEENVLDTTEQSVEETLTVIAKMLKMGKLKVFDISKTTR